MTLTGAKNPGRRDSVSTAREREKIVGLIREAFETRTDNEMLYFVRPSLSLVIGKGVSLTFICFLLIRSIDN